MRFNLDLSLPRSRPVAELPGKKLPPSQDKERLRKVAQEFEALLMEQMVKEMRAAVPESGLLGNLKGQEIFREMLDGEFVRLMSERGGIGLADFLVRTLEDRGLVK